MKYPAILNKKISSLYDFKKREVLTSGEKYLGEYLRYDIAGSLKKQKAFNALVKTLPNLPESKAYVGIEVEVEYAPVPFRHSGWTKEKDGSLRNCGQEYISRVLTPENINQNLAVLFMNLGIQEVLPQFSWRTSIHVHLCVRDRTIEEVLKIFLLYLTFERILFLFADKEREKSVFCVPLTRSSLSDNLADFFTQASSIDRLVKDWHKYSALNLTRLSDYGTMEFRHLPGTWDVPKISTWIGILLSLYNSAIRLSLDEIIEEIRTLNTTSKYMMFRDEVFGEFAKSLVIPDFDLVSEGVRFAKECLSGINQYTIEEGSSMMKYVKKEKEKKKDLPLKKLKIEMAPDLKLKKIPNTEIIIDDFDEDAVKRNMDEVPF